MDEDQALISVGEGEIIVFARTGTIEGKGTKVTQVSDADYVVLLATSGSGTVEWDSGRFTLNPAKRVSVPSGASYVIESLSDEAMVVTVFGVAKMGDGNLAR